MHQQRQPRGRRTGAPAVDEHERVDREGRDQVEPGQVVPEQAPEGAQREDQPGDPAGLGDVRQPELDRQRGEQAQHEPGRQAQHRRQHRDAGAERQRAGAARSRRAASGTATIHRAASPPRATTAASVRGRVAVGEPAAERVAQRDPGQEHADDRRPRLQVDPMNGASSRPATSCSTSSPALARNTTAPTPASRAVRTRRQDADRGDSRDGQCDGPRAKRRFRVEVRSSRPGGDRVSPTAMRLSHADYLSAHGARHGLPIRRRHRPRHHQLGPRLRGHRRRGDAKVTPVPDPAGRRPRRGRGPAAVAVVPLPARPRRAAGRGAEAAVGREPRLRVGEFARAFGSQVPTRLVASAKSWLCHPGVDRKAPILPFRAGETGRQVSPFEACVRYLKHLAEAWNHAMAKDVPRTPARSAGHRADRAGVVRRRGPRTDGRGRPRRRVRDT